MPELLKEYPTAVVVLVAFCLVGHMPVKLALRPEPGSRMSVFLRVWEAISLDVLKIIRTRAKDSAALKIIELIESAAPKDEPPTLLPPPPDSTTKPIILEPPAPEPPKEGQP